mmetsp:Transcript_33232/g.50122  ORF Transcript_33232/g.50122 Transcript_33232/m.50122 type:complete len:201 (-) Transcript_33232:15-617(-)
MANKRKHGVHFSEKNIICTIDRLSNPKEIWYSPQEFSMIQHAWVSSVRRIGNERGISYAQDLLSVFNDSVCMADRDPKSLARLAQWSDRRGLEFHTVQPIQKERTRQRSRVRGTVIELQKQLREQGIAYQGELLARVAGRLAAPAKAFARKLGETDAIAAIESNLLGHTHRFDQRKGSEYRYSEGSYSPIRPKKRIRISV